MLRVERLLPTLALNPNPGLDLQLSQGAKNGQRHEQIRMSELSESINQLPAGDDE